MGWLSGWQYRKSHGINSASGAGTNYQVRVKAHYGTGTDSGENVYLGGKCRTDFGDVRFTDDDGTTLLDYWMEEKVDENYAIFWVEVADDLSSANATIYIYYGKSNATTTSSKANTVIDYEDFEGGSLGKFIYGSSQYEAQTSVVKEGVYAARSFASSAQRYTADGEFWDADNRKIVCWIRSGTTSSGGAIDVYFTKNGYLRFLLGISDGGTFRYWTGAFNNFGSAQKNTWYKFIVKLRFTNNQVDFEIRDESDNLLYSYENINMGSLAVSYYDVMMYQSGSAVGSGYWDNFYVLKYVKPEPSHGSWGSEETALILKQWSQTVKTSHVFSRPFRFMSLSQTLKTLHALTVIYPGAILKQWFATLQTAHVLRRPLRRIGYTQSVTAVHVLGRPLRVIKFPAPLQLTHVFGRRYRFMKLFGQLGLVHMYYVAVPGVKKTRLFLVVGDLAIQLSSD